MEFQHELIIPNEGFPFKVFLFEGGNGNYVREKHWHTSVEIFAVMEGRLDFFVNKDEYPLKAGEQIIINSNEIHSIHAVEKNKTVVLQIPLKQFENYFTARDISVFGGRRSWWIRNWFLCFVNYIMCIPSGKLDMSSGQFLFFTRSCISW